MEVNHVFMDERSGFAERLRESMVRAGYAARPSVLEREFNTRYWGRSVTLQAVRRWLRGEAIPSQDKLQVLADWLQVEPQVLRFGDAVVRRVREQQRRWEVLPHREDRETIDVFLALPVAQRKVVREVVLAFARPLPAEPNSGQARKPQALSP